MDTLRLDGTTIRGVVRGRQINCLVHSAPVGLVLPAGRYLLRIENNPVFGVLVSVEAASGPDGLEPVGIHFKMPPAALKDAPAAVATLVPPGQATGFTPAPGNLKDVPANLKDSPASKFFTAGSAGSTRVIIAARPIGQNSLVAQAGFSDLAEIVQQVGVVALVVS
jgi:hypothetical protein